MAGEDHTASPGWPEQDQTVRRRTVSEAAELLGITAEAVRTRIKWGKLESVKEGGAVYVLLRIDQTGSNADPTVKDQDQTGIVGELRDRVAYLERQVEEEREARRRADTIIAQLSRANEELSVTIRAIEGPRGGCPRIPREPRPYPLPSNRNGGPQRGQ